MPKRPRSGTIESGASIALQAQMKFRRFFLLLPLFVLACGAAESADAESSNNALVEDILSMTQRADGRFDVRCRNGEQQIVTADDLRANRVCTPPVDPLAELRCDGPLPTVAELEHRVSYNEVPKPDMKFVARDCTRADAAATPTCSAWTPEKIHELRPSGGGENALVLSQRPTHDDETPTANVSWTIFNSNLGVEANDPSEGRVHCKIADLVAHRLTNQCDLTDRDTSGHHWNQSDSLYRVVGLPYRARVTGFSTGLTRSCASVEFKLTDNQATPQSWKEFRGILRARF